MRKDDYIRIHALMFQIRRGLEKHGLVEDEFTAYDALGVTPVSVHRDKAAHYNAICVLGEAINKILIKDKSATHTLFFRPPPKTPI